MKKLIIIGALLLGLALPGLAQTDILTPGMSGLQTRNAINTAFSETLGVVDTVNETIRIGGIQITANAAEVNIVDGALVNVTELNRLVGLPGNIVTLLAGKENSLGNPGTSGYVLSSTSGGTRSWIEPGSGGGATYPPEGIPYSLGASWGVSITNNSANWNTAYGWGNHAAAGYAPTSNATFTNTITLPSTTSIGNVSATEIGYNDGLNGTSASRNDVRDSLDNALDGAVEVIALVDSLKAVGQKAGSYVTGMDWNYGIEDNFLKGCIALGGNMKAFPMTGFFPATVHSLSDGYAYWSVFYLPETTTITGVGFIQSTQGVYTAADYNGVAIYSKGSTAWSLIDSSTDDGNIWKAAANTINTKAFSTGPRALSAGVYAVVLIYNQSAQTTAPQLQFNANRPHGRSMEITGNFVIFGVSYSASTPPASLGYASIYGNSEPPSIWLY